MADYVDFDYSMEKNMFGDINIVTDSNAIRQSIVDILMTIIGERGEFEPRYGSKLYYFLMEKITPITAIQIKDEISNVLKVWEPRINLYRIDIEPKPEQNVYDITLNYQNLRASEIETISFQLEKI